MPCLAHIFLCILHRLYLLFTALRSYWKWLTWNPPAPLDVPRSRVPKHLALLISECGQPSDEVEEDLIECVTRAVGWCRTVGIRRLTVYDEHGTLLHYAPRIQQRVQDCPSELDSSASEIEYPLSPPPSDYADSRPLSPTSNFTSPFIIGIPHCATKPRNHLNVRKRRSHKRKTASNALTLCIISRDSAKPAVATAACSLLQANRRCQAPTRAPEITVDSLDTLLECDSGLSSPDFMIVHSINLPDSEAPLELHGFPPWHIQLTEIHQSHVQRRCRTNSGILDEITFREALDEYALAEFRFGK